MVAPEASRTCDDVPVRDLASFLASLDRLGAEPPVNAAPPERVLLGYAPTALLDGAWLGAWLRVADAHTELGAAVLDAFTHEVGASDRGRHHGNLYRGVLGAAGLALEDPPSAGFAADSRLQPADFELALIGLETPNLGWSLGVHAFLCRHGLPAALRDALPRVSGGFREVHEPASDDAARAERLSRRCLEAYAAQPEPDWSSVWQGALALDRARRRWLESLASEPRSAAQAMQELIARKAPHARGYHPNLQLAGRSLDAWLDPASLDAPALLERLAASSYVVAGKPEQSPLFLSAARFGSAMFGAFTEGDLEITRRWILSLADPATPGPPLTRLGVDVRPAAGAAVSAAAEPTPSLRLGLRESYHRLLNDGAVPLDHTRALLDEASARTGAAALKARGLWPYAPERLWTFVDRRHREQVDEAPGLIDRALDRLTRRDVAWMLTQLAPAAFIDGAWLSGLAAPEPLRSPSAGLLFRIYRDELGAGQAARHHGNVFDSALRGAGVELPAARSRAFAESPLFVDAAFCMPVHWLLVAQGGAELWPELLGLNLAVEIAGLGAGYARAAALLRKHGLDPYFFELHNAIDNPASGHTAWSARAITLHLDELVARGDTAHADRTWQRVWSGFDSYALASSRLSRAVTLRLAPRLLRSVWR